MYTSRNYLTLNISLQVRYDWQIQPRFKTYYIQSTYTSITSQSFTRLSLHLQETWITYFSVLNLETKSKRSHTIPTEGVIYPNHSTI